MMDTYRNELTKELFKKIFFFIAVIIILLVVVSLLFIKKSSNRFSLLERHVERMSKRNWHEPIEIEEMDEIGRLALSIEDMRKQLVQYDEQQKFRFHSISHELKTPIMIIQGYIQGITDGMIPQEALEDSWGIIEKEANRLEKLVKNILYINKLEYLNTKDHSWKTIQLHEILREVITSLQMKRERLKWEIAIESAALKGSKDRITIVFENILDNQVRYAHSTIFVSLQKEKKI